MSPRRAVAFGCLITLAVLLQVTVLTRLALPGGGPALVVLVVGVVAVLDGPAAGMLVGFAGGLLADLAPPSEHRLGQSMLVLVCVGEFVGLLHRRSAGMMRSAVLVGVATLLAGLGVAALDLVLGYGPGGIGSALRMIGATTAYNVVLAIPLLAVGGGQRHRAGAPGRAARSVRVSGTGRRRDDRVGSSAAAGGLR
ncbi:MAG: rod shape-determining protein MreD [Frankiaceae bacterium]